VKHTFDKFEFKRYAASDCLRGKTNPDSSGYCGLILRTKTDQPNKKHKNMSWRLAAIFGAY
jgi:hypothetical protein